MPAYKTLIGFTTAYRRSSSIDRNRKASPEAMVKHLIGRNTDSVAKNFSTRKTGFYTEITSIMDDYLKLRQGSVRLLDDYSRVRQARLKNQHSK